MSPEATPEPPEHVVERLFASPLPKIYDYVDLLTSTAVTRGILGPREASRVWPRHILNCAVIAPLFPARQTVCDIGSGAGLPGVVLAIARPDLTVTMLEPLLRRVTFLREVVAHLGLDNAVVLRARAQEAANGARFGAVTARAVAPLARLAGWAFPLLAPGGELIAIKGRIAADELTAAFPVLRRLGARNARVESYGRGIVDPETIVVRIESGGGGGPSRGSGT